MPTVILARVLLVVVTTVLHHEALRLLSAGLLLIGWTASFTCLCMERFWWSATGAGA
jgi:hypothetical protein